MTSVLPRDYSVPQKLMGIVYARRPGTWDPNIELSERRATAWSEIAQCSQEVPDLDFEVHADSDSPQRGRTVKELCEERGYV